MKLIIELDLDAAGLENADHEDVRRLIDGLCDRLPYPLTETNGGLSIHNGEQWVGEARIE